MKKAILALVMILMISLSLLSCSKKAEPIMLPATKEITSIEIAGGIKDTICTDEKAITSFVQKVSEAIPTTKESTQDVPTVPEYTKVDLVYSGKISKLFIYQENSKWYIEQPYKGIYETDETILGLLGT